jgi:serine/threonine protein phosphatase PrpC
MASPTNFTLEFALASHAGQVRPLNEDAIGAQPDLGLFVLCDGLGGYNAGEIAATMAVSSLLSTLASDYRQAQERGTPFDPRGILSERMIEMNGVISRAAASGPAFEGMATTIVIAWILGDRLWIAHAGDSRLYRFREGVLEAMTRDHSFSQELLDAGMVTEEEARMLPSKNLVTRALGAGGDVDPEVNDYPLRVGDVLMLCSDGLTEMVDDVQIAGAIFASVPDVQRAAQRLIDMANAAGGRDNVSVIVVRLAGRKGLEPRRTSAGESRPSTPLNAASPSG